MDNLTTDLKVTAETVAEYRPGQKAREMIASAMEAKHPDIYDSPDAYLRFGSCWFVEIPQYIDYLVQSGDERLAERLLSLLLSDRNPTGDLMHGAWREVMNYRLDRTYWGKKELERQLTANGL